MIDKFIYVDKFDSDIKRLVAEFSIDGIKIKALIDTGASQNHFCSSLKTLPINKKDYGNVVGFTGHSKRTYGVKPFTIPEYSLKFSGFYSLNLEHLKVNCVLGFPFLTDNAVVIDFGKFTNEKISGINFSSDLLIES